MTGVLMRRRRCIGAKAVRMEAGIGATCLPAKDGRPPPGPGRGEKTRPRNLPKEPALLTLDFGRLASDRQENKRLLFQPHISEMTVKREQRRTERPAPRPRSAGEQDVPAAGSRPGGAGTSRAPGRGTAPGRRWGPGFPLQPGFRGIFSFCHINVSLIPNGTNTN